MKKIVIKLGGSSLENAETQCELSLLVRGLREAGHSVAVVHGGGPAINRELLARGISWTFVEGQRRTTSPMMEVIEEVLAGSVNQAVVRSLRDNGIAAAGLSGAPDGILHCSFISAELGLVGQVDRVSLDPIQAALRAGRVPVIAPIGLGAGAQKANVNADWAAARVATALEADDLIFLTDQDGVLDPTGGLIRRATPEDLQKNIDDGSISGGMRTKALAMIEALRKGVKKVRVLNARQAGRILTEGTVGTSLARPRSVQKTRKPKDGPCLPIPETRRRRGSPRFANSSGRASPAPRKSFATP